MNKEQLFQRVFEDILDYSDGAFVEKCATWGLDILEILEKNGRVLVADGGERGNDFIYAVTTALIVGEFGKLAFNNYFSEEAEINFEQIGLEFGDIEAYIDDDTTTERREELRKGNYVRLEDIRSSVQEWKKETHRELVTVYTGNGEEEPVDAIYASLVVIFEQKDEETGEVAPPFSRHGFSSELKAYSYVNSGFQY